MSLRRHIGAATVAVAALLSLWLRAAFPPFGVWGPHDDALFLRRARELAAGHWLGPYDPLILAKGMFYSLFIALNQATGLPLKLSEHGVFLLAALLAGATFARASRKPWMLPLVFVTLAFSPTQWTEAGARVVREPLYQSLGLALFFATALHFLDATRRRLALGVGLGLLAACYWLTREEGLWLLPSLAIVVLPWLVARLRHVRTRVGESGSKAGWRESALILACPLATFLLAVLAVDSANLAAYGVFRDNDMREGSFPDAYGALTRIEHEHWQSRVPFPRDARQKAYAVSPAARELMPFFETPHPKAKGWLLASRPYPKPWGCSGEPASCNDEILGGWLIWALRDAVAEAGHYRSAREADAYQRRLADEIDAACADGAIPCRPPRSGLIPAWRSEQLPDVLAAAAQVFATLVRLDGGRVGVPKSPITAAQAAVFEVSINDEVSGFEGVENAGASDVARWLRAARLRITEAVGALYATASPLLFALALAGYLFLLVGWLTGSAAVEAHSIALLSGLLAAVLVRVAMLGFLEATFLPSNNLLYLLPAVPFHLAFVAASLGLAVSAIAHRLRISGGGDA